MKSKVVCYWDANDREYGTATSKEIADAHEGEVCEVEHVAIVNTTYECVLPETDEFEEVHIIADTLEEAEALRAAELDRRGIDP